MNSFVKHNCSDILVCNGETVKQIKQLVKFLTTFLKMYSELTASYILDYFIEELWTCFPSCWTETVMKFESEDLANFLDCDKQMKYKNPWPLSLLSFRACAFSLSLSRKPVTSLKSIRNFITENYKVDCLSENNWDCLDSAYEVKSGQHKSIPEFCRRHVKPKKQHEIFRMGQLAAAVLGAFEIKHAIDIGSGQGHLSRFLSLCYKVNVATVEAEESHLLSAANFDKQAFITMKKSREHWDDCKETETDIAGQVLPQHLEGSMTTETSKEFLNIILKRSQENFLYDSEKTFALLGLHTCGDLASTILKLFTECQGSKAVLSVGCCYMKLTSAVSDEGYPLSSYVKSLPDHQLSYEAKEMACHALEMYRKRLIENSPTLKIHCYRATLEKCILHHYPEKKHMGLRGVKNAENLPFFEYAKKALSKVSCAIPDEYYLCPDIQACLEKWKEVLVFYSLRLLIAPVVESLILLDRMLFLYECGHSSCLIPLFDPKISPRNHVLFSASKS